LRLHDPRTFRDVVPLRLHDPRNFTEVVRLRAHDLRNFTEVAAGLWPAFRRLSTGFRGILAINGRCGEAVIHVDRTTPPECPHVPNVSRHRSNPGC
jgi:hypothetical protein